MPLKTDRPSRHILTKTPHPPLPPANTRRRAGPNNPPVSPGGAWSTALSAGRALRGARFNAVSRAPCRGMLTSESTSNPRPRFQVRRHATPFYGREGTFAPSLFLGDGNPRTWTLESKLVVIYTLIMFVHRADEHERFDSKWLVFWFKNEPPEV